MIAFFVKKVTPSTGAEILSLSWQNGSGLLALGCRDGMLKVVDASHILGAVSRDSVKEEDGTGSRPRTESKIHQLQTLSTPKDPGATHTADVHLVAWNESENSLTSVDRAGCIAIWRAEASRWVNELTNTDNSKKVVDVAWAPDGKKICILAADGNLVLGAANGKRLWSKDLKRAMTRAACIAQKKHLHTLVVPNHVEATAFSWAAGGDCLAVASKGVVLFATVRMKTPAAYFAQTLAYAHTASPTRGQAFALWFWNVDTSSKHLRYIRLPLRQLLGSGQCCVVITDAHEEEGTTEAVEDSHKSENSAEKNSNPQKDLRKQFAVSLYNSIAEPMKTTYTEVEPEFAAITDGHVLVADCRRVFLWRFATSREQTGKTQTALERPNPAGKNSAMGSVAASCSIMASLAGTEDTPCLGRSETVVEVETALSTGSTEEGQSAKTARNCAGGQPRWGRGGNQARNPIVALAAANGCFVVARRNGELRRYSLPGAELEAICSTETPPLSIYLNCDATRLAVIDIFNSLALRHAVPPSLPEEENVESPEPSHRQEGQLFGASMNFARQDVFDVLWSRDEADLFAMVEKSTIYLVRGTALEEPLRCSASFLGDLNELRLELFYLDELQKTPAEPNTCLHRLHYETKRLRDTRDILEKAQELDDAITYAENASHTSLWKLIARSALDKMKLDIAEKAFVTCQDYCGLQFIKRLRSLDAEKREAEVRAYFGDFDRAEALYLEMDRRDLALTLRSDVGDWARVIQLARDPAAAGLMCTSDVLQIATKALGDSCRERGQWPEAIQAYRSIGDHRSLAHAYHIMEQFDELENMIGDLLPDTHREQLLEIGEKLASVGLCPAAVRAFTKAGDTKAAVDCCIRLNEWDTAITLSEQARFQEVEALLTKCARHLLDQSKRIQAVQLYQRAQKPLEAATILMQLASRGEGSAPHPGIQSPQYKPERKKKLYVLAALEVEKFAQQKLQGGLQAQSPTMQRSGDPSASSTALGNATAAAGEATGAEGVVGTGTPATRSALLPQTHTCPMTQGNAFQKAENKALDRRWRGAEAFHLYLLVHKQLTNGAYDAAVCTAVQLTEYSDFVDGLTAFSILALASFYARNWELCSKAFMYLENCSDVPEEQREAFGELAVEIFSRHPPPAHENENPPLVESRSASASPAGVPYTRMIPPPLELLAKLVDSRIMARLNKSCYRVAHVVTKCSQWRRDVLKIVLYVTHLCKMGYRAYGTNAALPL
ncbi:GA15220, related [Neospora caninum Liverpool]|uniref:GA15220, related n=1 Tax=Neospora caninum (strain Liverpool) TaxID=572307 RepID=F0VHM2_NEOCL|nr:GA15220, related [Neospora caninum Liverpool]CBZ53216.1 GA15220, related [Neospora caninum Liverpool]CEL67206.1 TPA: GA15220, related [Neospora caninum Liverpool]|eukprot:XP_003883248.1 GA15220, related [Neospora caninum Liverpool]